jgi:hypothetical protein
MGQDKLHLNDWIVQLARLIDDLESEREPRRRLISLTARLGLKNWLVYRAMTPEPRLLSTSPSTRSWRDACRNIFSSVV